MFQENIRNPKQQLNGDSADYDSKSKNEVPLWRKTLLSLDEASKYTGVGIHKLRDISNSEDCNFVVWNGSKRMFKRRLLEEYLESAFSI